MIKKILFGILLGILIFSLVLGVFVCIQIRQMQPDYDVSHKVASLSRPVTIHWDSTGVIHVEGEGKADVIFASGYAAAMERLWQMEITRRVASGRLSEVFGATTLEIDRLFRTLDLDSLTDQLFLTISPESQNWLEYYARGINQYLDDIGEELPVEFLLLGTKPEKWSARDCLLQNRLMAWILNFNWSADLLYWRLSGTLPQNLFREILPQWDSNSMILSGNELNRFSFKLLAVREQLTELLGIGKLPPGSNNWVIAPYKSASGAAMLANDPHLELRLPSIWIEMHLKSADLNVAGFSLAGSPGIIIGRNQHIAWGVTNGMIDDCDYFIEKIDTVEQTYWKNGEKLPLIKRTETIEIKDESPEIHTTYATGNGPLFNQIFPEISLPHPISLKWVGWENSDELFTFIQLATAKNWSDFTQALQTYHVPAQNFVYADANGHIGYRLGGRIPIRTYEDGLIPRLGYQGKNSWSGWVDFDELPSDFDPNRGWIATANNLIDEDYPYYLSQLWEPPFRIMRIEEMMENHQKISLDQMREMQMDSQNLLAREILPIVLRELKMLHKPGQMREDLILLLETWDYRMDRDKVAPAVYEVLQHMLIRKIFSDEMEAQLFELFTNLPNFYLRIFHQLFQRDNSMWFDNISTPGVETRREIIDQSLEETLHFMEERMGSQVSGWRWGELNQLELEHFLGKMVLTRKIFNRGPFPFAGSGTTVNAGIFSYDNPFKVTGGASMRFLVDWEQKGTYWSIVPGGNSGNFLSDFYDNQISWWRSGKLKRVSLFEIGASRKVRLVPLGE